MGDLLSSINGHYYRRDASGIGSAPHSGERVTQDLGTAQSAKLS